MAHFLTAEFQKSTNQLEIQPAHSENRDNNINKNLFSICKAIGKIEELKIKLSSLEKRVCQIPLIYKTVD